MEGTFRLLPLIEMGDMNHLLHAVPKKHHRLKWQFFSFKFYWDLLRRRYVDDASMKSTAMNLATLRVITYGHNNNVMFHTRSEL